MRERMRLCKSVSNKGVVGQWVVRVGQYSADGRWAAMRVGAPEGTA